MGPYGKPPGIGSAPAPPAAAPLPLLPRGIPAAPAHVAAAPAVGQRGGGGAVPGTNPNSINVPSPTDVPMRGPIPSTSPSSFSAPDPAATPLPPPSIPLSSPSPPRPISVQHSMCGLPTPAHLPTGVCWDLLTESMRMKALGWRWVTLALCSRTVTSYGVLGSKQKGRDSSTYLQKGRRRVTERWPEECSRTWPHSSP